MKNIKLKKYRYFKILNKNNLLKNYLKNINFILIFYYDFLSTQQKLNLKKNLDSKNLKIINIKNKSNIDIINNNSIFKPLKNLLNNNVILIYNKDNNNSTIDTNKLNYLMNLKKIKLAGVLWNKKFYRPSVLKKYVSLNENIKQNTIIQVSSIINNLKFILSNLKKSV